MAGMDLCLTVGIKGDAPIISLVPDVSFSIPSKTALKLSDMTSRLFAVLTNNKEKQTFSLGFLGELQSFFSRWTKVCPKNCVPTRGQTLFRSTICLIYEQPTPSTSHVTDTCRVNIIYARLEQVTGWLLIGPLMLFYV
jgi:hypothetical protein